MTAWQCQSLITFEFAHRVPTLLISSAKDRLLGSLQEGARLERVMHNAMRIVLPKSGHTALLEVRPHPPLGNKAPAAIELRQGSLDNSTADTTLAKGPAKWLPR